MAHLVYSIKTMALVKFVFLFLILVSQDLFAQASKDPTDPTAVGYTKTNLKQKKWFSSASASAVRGLDYYAKVYLSYSGALIYKPNKKVSTSAGLSYSAPADGQVTFPQDWGVSDLSFSYTKADAVKIFERGNTSFRASLVLPTSKKSQRASLKGLLSLSIPTSFRLGGFSLSLSPGVGLGLYEFETADLNGGARNYPVRLPLRFSLSKSIYERLRGALSGGYTSLWDAYGDSIGVQSLSFSLSYPVYKGLSLSGGYSWSDRRVSNLSAFDDDRSRYFLSLSFYN